MRLVLIEWLDAYSAPSGWKSRDSLKAQKPIAVKSVGYMIEDNPQFITLASSWVEDDDMDGDITILRGMITEIRELACWPNESPVP